MGARMTNQVSINDLKRHAASTDAVVRDAIDRVLGSGWYILGREGEAFEREFADFCGTTDCIAVANGTDAIELGLRALGIGPGNRVATVANAGLYTTTALLALGAEPVFVEVDQETRLMSLEHLGKVLADDKIDVVVVTHLFGLLHDMDAVLRLTDATGIPVFEDCAQAHGAGRGARRAGSFGKAASFSFYPTKNLGALGDGGAVTTSDAEVASHIRRLRQYGWESKYRAVLTGARNSRLDEMQAAILRAKLPSLDAWNRRRRAIATRYSNEIVNPRVICPPVYGEEYVGHLYVITCDDRDSLRSHLSAHGILTDVHYPIPDYQQPSLQNQRDWKALPITEALAKSILTLPCYPELQDDEVARVIACMNDW